MPLFLTDEEHNRYINDAPTIIEKADSFIRDLYSQLETVKAQAEASSITAEQNCSLLEQQFVSLSADYAKLESQNAQLSSSLDQALSELAQVQSDKHQLHLKLMEKDGEIERLKMEVSEFHKSKRQSMEYLEQKDSEISEKNATIKSYLDRIVNLSENAAIRETRCNEFEAELARCKAACTRLSQEKELIERHNVWLNEELEAKGDSLVQLRKTHAELEADMSTKLGDLERKYNECSSSLKRSMDRSKELESKLKSCQEELCSARDAAGTNEEQFSAEITTVNKLADLYKESSEEWSQKATELEGVIKALETHLSQVESSNKSKLETEASTRKELEKTTMDLKEKLEKSEAEIESYRKANELNLLPLSAFTTTTDRWTSSFETDDAIADHHMLIPKIPAGVSGTALAASLLRDGWSLSKMYSKYQEAVDALRHEQLGRKSSEAILQRVLSELEEKAELFFDERAEHERMVEAYSLINQNLQHSLSEQANLEQTILELKADLQRQYRDYTVAQRQIVDLQNQVTVLLKECRDIQLRGGSFDLDDVEDNMLISAVEMITESDADKVISERLLTFKNINGLVEQNVQLRSLVRNLTDQIATGHNELQEKFEMEIKKHMDEAASKVAVVMQRAEEQGRMIESLHTSVAMYKRLYEEEHKLHLSFSESVPRSVEGIQEGGMNELMRLLEGSQEGSKNAKEQSAAKVRSLEEDLAKARNEIISIRTERDKLSLEINFAREKLDDFMREFEHQRTESNGILARNVEFSQLIVDYQRKLREASESINVAEELSRKLTMEVSVLKHEKEMLSNAEKKAYDEVRSMSDRVYRLQAGLDTIESATEVREEARALERSRQEEHIKQVEREWAEAKRELQEERNNVRTLSLDREQTMNNAMKQVEDMRQELANALKTVANAEARATIAEARLSDLEKKIKSTDIGVFGIGSGGGPSLPSDKVIDELRMAKEEIEKWKLEAQSNKDHMLQYKNISQVNEDALKQMESAHEDFKIEADKLKISLESELLSLKQRVHELESDYCLKSVEAASAAAGKAQALDTALSEVITLKQAISAKTGKITTMEIQISDLKEDLEKEHQRWCAAQANYERQVILQSETIQELTKTSQALASLQKEASELRKSADAFQLENNELKMKWEAERSMLEQLKKEAEKKFNDINEQNKILHNRLEAMHIQLAEKDRSFAGISSGETVADPVGDFGLQNVVNYLRRSKEIAETEISLLKQEKLRFQSQLGNALKTAEAAEATLHSERAKSRALILSGEEIKSLQLQVREMNLLRESNIQLREENKHNFEEWQKYREIAQRASAEKENIESQLKEKDIALESCQNAINALKTERDNLEKRVRELLEKFQSIDVENHHRLKGDVRLMQIKIEEKDALIETLKKQLSESHDKISKLEQDVAYSGSGLKERDMKINDLLKEEATLKSEVQKQKKLVSQLKVANVTLKRRTDREKEEVTKENQALTRQLEELKQGKGSIGDLSLEQAMKEKNEKDRRILSLENAIERLREDLRKAKDDQRVEKNTCLKDDEVILFRDQVVQERTKFLNEFERHKGELMRLHEEIENVKHLKGNLPEGTPIQHLSGTVLDDCAADNSAAVENLNTVTQSISGDPESRFLANTSSRAESPSVVAVTGQEVFVQSSSSTVPPAGPGTASLPPKVAIESGKRPSLPKTNAETRKPPRRLVRPRLSNTEEPQGDTEMLEADVPNSGGKLDSSQDFGTPGNITLQTQPPARKRQAISSLSEVHEESATKRDTTLKKVKGSDSQQDCAEGISITLSSEVSEIAPNSVEIIDAIDSGNEVIVDTEKNALETTDGQTDDPKEPLVDETSPVDLQNEEDDNLKDLFDKPIDAEMLSSNLLDDQAEEDVGQSTMYSDREEGEMAPDNADVEAGELLKPMQHEASPNQENVPSARETENVGDPESVVVLNDDGSEVKDVIDGSDKSNEATEQTPNETNQISELLSTVEGSVVTPAVVTEVPVSATTVETEVPVSTPNVWASISGEGSSSVTGDTEETRQPSPAGSNSTTMISIEEMAKKRSQERMQTLANNQTPSPGRVPRGRGVPRSRVMRGRTGRGRRPPSNEQS